MKRSTRRLVAALNAVVIMLSAAACGSDGSADKTASPGTTTIRYGISGNLSVYWHVFAGQQQGIFAKHGIKLKVTTTQSGSASDLLSLLMARDVDIADVLPDAVIAASTNSNRVKVLNLTASGPYSLVARQGIHSFDDLKKLPKVKAAVSSATTATAGLTKRMLGQAGIPDSKTQLVVSGGTSSRLAAVQSGAVDVALLVQPADFQAQEKGLTILGDSVATAPWYGLTDTVLSSSLSKNCAAYKKFFAAMWEIHDFLIDPKNKQQAIDSLVASKVSSAQDAEKTYELYVKDKAMPGVNDPTATLKQTNSLLSSLGPKSMSDPGTLVDTSCVS